MPYANKILKARNRSDGMEREENERTFKYSGADGNSGRLRKFRESMGLKSDSFKQKTGQEKNFAVP